MDKLNVSTLFLPIKTPDDPKLVSASLADGLIVDNAATIFDPGTSILDFSPPAGGKTPVAFDIVNAPNASLGVNSNGAYTANLVVNGTFNVNTVTVNTAIVSGVDAFGASGWTTVPIRPGRTTGNANNVNGLNLAIQGGQGTGSGNGGDIDFQVKSANGSGNQVLTTLSNALVVSGQTATEGNVGIGTVSPYSRLQVTGPDTASTSAFAVVNSASTTEFSVYDTGNAVLSGGLMQSSDQRLKTNIQSLNASSSLAAIDALNPVTFNWIDPNKGSTPQLGFIAQQVLPIFPTLVSTTSATALTPDGTLGLNYSGLISPIVSAIQALSADITSIESAIAGFAQSITSAVGNFGQLNSTVDSTQKLCVTDSPDDPNPVCVTKAQLAALLSAAAAPATTESVTSPPPSNPSPTPPVSVTSPASSTPPESVTSSATPPVIQINGDSPAIVQVGATYNDLGATITGPQADLNLGIRTYLNGALVSNIVLDTSAAATDTIDYVATDQSGLTATSTRIVIVESPASTNNATTSSTSPASTDTASTPQ